MHAAGKIFGKMYLKSIKDTFIPNIWSVIWTRVQTFGLAGRSLPLLPPLVGHPKLPIRKTLMRVVGLLTITILKRLIESVFFRRKDLQYVKLKIKKG